MKRKYDRRVLAEQVHLLYRQAIFLLFANLVLSGFAVYVLWDFVARRPLLIWFAANWLLAAVRFGVILRFRRSSPAGEDMRRWGVYAVVSSALYGCLWGFFGAAFLAPEQPLVVVFICVILMGISAGSFAAQSAYLPAYVALTFPMLLPLIVRLAVEDGVIYGSLTLITAFFLVAISHYARNNNHMLTAAIRLRFDNADLAAELAKQKERAEQANLAKSKFLAAASHDLRQPIHAQALLLDALDVSTSDAASRKIVDDVRLSSRNLNELLEGLLDISKLDAGVVKPEPASFALQPIFDIVRREHAMSAREKGLDLRVMPCRAVVRSDRAMLQRILNNLVSNAIRYTDEGRIVVGARRRGGRLRIEVWDTGKGIPAGQTERIFEEFCQLHNQERDRAKGLGLGLAIVRRLCELLGHDIEVRSREGAGSMFAITVPAASRGAEPAEAREALRPMNVLDGVRVLVIDDEAAVRRATATLLQRWNCKAIVAESAADALRQFDLGEPPDVIVADYRLGDGETGVRAVEQLRAHTGTRIPALILTGDTAADRIAEAQASGLHLLHKPVDPAKLRALLAYLIEPVFQAR